MGRTVTKGHTAETGGRHLNFAKGSYLDSTSRPWYALLFLLPLVVVYEVGVVANVGSITESPPLVATFTWLMGLAEWLGVARSVAWAFPGIVVVIILLCWHLSSQDPWQVRWRWLLWMTVECVVLAAPLFAVAAVLNMSLDFAAAEAGASGELQSYPAQIITSIGAGVYEELVFRLILLGLILIVMEDLLKIKAPLPAVTAVRVSALLFAAHHHIGIEAGNIAPLGEKFGAGPFAFRTAAGIYFAVIFRYRGYGVAAGAHIAYDIIYYTLTDTA